MNNEPPQFPPNRIRMNDGGVHLLKCAHVVSAGKFECDCENERRQRNKVPTQHAFDIKRNREIPQDERDTDNEQR